MTRKNIIKNKIFSLNNFYLFIFLIIIISFCIELLFLYKHENISTQNNITYTIISKLVPIIAIPASFLYILIFIFPGYLFSRSLLKKIINKKDLLLSSITFSTLLAYFIFWIYYFNLKAGKITSILLILSAIILIISKYNYYKNELFDKDFIYPLVLCFIVGCMYLNSIILDSCTL